MTRLFAALAAALVLLAGPPARADGSLDRVIAAKALRVAVELTAPWAMRDAKGELTGFEVDLARRLAADLGVEPVFVERPFAGLLPALAAGEADLVAAGLTITAERARSVLFSDPTNYTGVSLVVPVTTDPDAPPPGTAGTRIAVLADSSDAAVAAVAFPDATIVPFASMSEAVAAVLSGEAEAMAGTSPAPEIAAHVYDAQLVLSPEGPLSQQADAFALAPADVRLLLFVNSWIAAREADGFLPALREHYFAGFDWLDGMPNSD